MAIPVDNLLVFTPEIQKLLPALCARLIGSSQNGVDNVNVQLSCADGKFNNCIQMRQNPVCHMENGVIDVIKAIGAPQGCANCVRAMDSDVKAKLKV